LKKLLTALLVVAMILGLSSVAFAATFSDTADLKQEDQASIAKLNALNIINGYPDGTFKPDNNITRAEFAKIACIAGGMGTSADMLKSSPSRFTDVAAGQWYTGYVNLANSQGWVKGFPDGTFRPNNQITYAEVITVLVRILGYNDNLPGPWPVDYIAKAGALDITKNVSFDANAPATRGDVAVMTDATLDCEMVKWDNDTEDFEEQTYTLLEKKFDSAVNEDYLVTGVEFDDDVWSIKVKATDDDDDALDGKWLDLADDCMVSDGSLPTGLGSKMVDILYNDDDGEVLYLEVTSTTVTVDGEDWKVTKKRDSDSVPTQYEIDGTKYDVADWVLASATNITNQLDVQDTADFRENVFYRAWLNEDKDIYKVAARPTKTPAIVEEYEDGELTVKYEGDYGAYDEIEDIDFEDDSVLIEKDGAFVDPEDLKENDVIYVSDGTYGFDYYIEVAGTISKTGTYSGFRTKGSGATAYNQVRIDGTWYDVADENALSDDDGEEFNDSITENNLEDYDDEVITYFLNKSNQVCFIITGEVGKAARSKIYGLVTDLGYTVSRDGTKVTTITVLKEDGKEVKYDVDTSEVKLYMPDGSAVEDGKEVKYDVLDIDDFIKFTVDEDNNIDSLTILAQTKESGTSVIVVEPDDKIDSDYRDDANDKYIGTITNGDDDYNRIEFGGKWYNVNDKTVVFNGETYRNDDAEVVTIAELIDWAAELKLTTDDGVTAYVEYDGNTVKYVYVNHEVTSSVGGDYAAITDLYKRGRNQWAEVDIAGETKDYEVKSSVSTPKIGAIYKYSLSSGDIKFDAVVLDPISNNFANQAVDAAVYASDDKDRPYTNKYYAYQVEQVDKGAKAVKVNGTWVYAGDDTAVYDYDGGVEDVKSAKISSVRKNDYIVFFGDLNELDLLVIVTDIVD